MLGADVPMITPKDINLPAVIYEMACQAATVCSPGNYCNYWTLFICVHIGELIKSESLYKLSVQIAAAKYYLLLIGYMSLPFIVY